MNKLIYRSLFLLAVILAPFAGCKKKKDTNPNPDNNTPYSAMVAIGSWPNTAYYIIDIPSLAEGTVDLRGNGAEMTAELYAQDVLQKNGYYYHANAGAGMLGKYHVEDGRLITDQKIPFTTLDWSSYTWIDDNKLAIFGTNGDQDEGYYAIIQTSDMRVLSSGKLNLLPLPENFSRYSIGFAEYRDNKLFLSYGFGSTDWSQYPLMPVHGETYIAVIDYSSFNVEKSLKGAQLKGMGGPTVYAPTSFIDENNDLYFISDPVNIYDYNSPSVIGRIRSGSTELDASYSLDFSAATSNGMGAAMWYLGNGKAIVRGRIAGQSIDAEHYFAIVNVHTGSFIKKLDLPTDMGERMVQAVIVENGKAYIAVNGQQKDYIAIYDPATDTLTEGAEFVGGVDYILRLEKKR